MRYLFDTQIILWVLANDEHLSKKALDIINDPKNDILYSTVSSWEIEIKHLKNKNFTLNSEQFSFLCDQNGLINIQISNKHIKELKNLKKDENVSHNDPFDRMLLAQAVSEKLIFVTHDKKFKAYSNSNILMV